MTTVDLLLMQFDHAFDRRSWHGTNLRGSIRGVSARDAIWRPGGGRRNIQEVVVHAAYWKYAVHRRLTGGTRGSFPLKGSNWFERATQSDDEWRADVRLLDDTHRALRAVVAGMSPRQLGESAPGTRIPVQVLLSGIIAHDLYHAGQIQLLKRLMR